jgi:hypothetical protein
MGNNPLTQQTPPPPQQLPSFYVAVNGQTTGPFKLDVLQGMIMSGDVVANTYVYRVGGTAWVYASQEPEIAQILSSLTPPPPPPGA